MGVQKHIRPDLGTDSEVASTEIRTDVLFVHHRIGPRPWTYAIRAEANRAVAPDTPLGTATEPGLGPKRHAGRDGKI